MKKRKQKVKKKHQQIQELFLPIFLTENMKLRLRTFQAWSNRNAKKAGKWEVPIPNVKAVSEADVFKVLKSGKTRRKGWKRMVTKVTFVGENFTRKPPKFERFIRPMALRFKKAHVTHPELKATFCLPIIGVKKNPSSPMYTSLGVITKGTIIEINISEL